MSVLFDVLLIILLFSFFGYFHSYLASVKFKQLVLRKYGSYIAFYRLFYNIISFITFYLFYKISPKPDIIIFDLDYPFDIIVFILQAIILIGLLWAGSVIDWREFIGISQINRWYKGNYKIEDLDEKTELITKGPFKYSRHPVYFFTILFLGLRPTMNLFYFVFFVCIVVYFYIGSYYEEKKLLGKFGKDYSDYIKNVPRIIPNVLNKNR